MLVFFVIIPLGAAFLTALLGRKIKNLGDLIANLTGLALFIMALFLAKQTAGVQQAAVYRIGWWPAPLGINFMTDGLSRFMIFTVNLVAFLVMLYATSYMRHYGGKWKFHTLFLLMLAGMNGVILSQDLFNLYVFLELASLCAYALVAFGTEPQDLEAAFKYAIMGALASIFILLGIALIYSYTSTLNLKEISLALAARPAGRLVGFISVLFLAGFGLKAALVPFHAWLPDAHSSAPAPVSAALSGIFIKTLGIYTLLRVFFNTFSFSGNLLSVFLVLGILSMTAGAFLAIVQKDIKRMLAYSSISQVGFIIFAFGIGTPLALCAGLFHLFNHAVSKSLLFLNAGAIEYSTNTRQLDKLGGLNNKLPISGCTSLIGSMSISGIPPLGGFWSKLLIIIAAVEAGHPVLAMVAVLVSIVTLAYYLRFQTAVFFGKLNASLSEIKASPLTMKMAMIILAIFCITSGLMLTPHFKPFLQSAVGALSLNR